MSVFKFRVTFEDYSETYKDIEVLSEHSFGVFLKTLLAAIRFDTTQDAVFYNSDDYWKKKEVIAEIRAEQKNKKVYISDYIEQPYQRFILVYQPNWTFTIELLKISKDQDSNKDYPFVTPNTLILPAQYKELLIKEVEEQESIKEVDPLLQLLSASASENDDDDLEPELDDEPDFASASFEDENLDEMGHEEGSSGLDEDIEDLFNEAMEEGSEYLDDDY